jgi:hypothetical protein
LSPTSRPYTDLKLDFEDLIIYATNFQVVSSPGMAAKPASATSTSSAAEQFRLEAPTLVTVGGEVTATVRLTAAGRMQGFSLALAWDPTVVEPIGMSSGNWIEGQGGVVLQPKPGTVDAALLGVRGDGIEGDGTVAVVRFRVLQNGATGIGVAKVVARDGGNREVNAGAIATKVEAAVPTVTELSAPWPNPFGDRAGLMYSLAAEGAVELTVYGVDGRRVRGLVSERQAAGVYRVEWDGRDDGRNVVGSGVYYAQLRVAGKRFTKTVVRVR